MLQMHGNSLSIISDLAFVKRTLARLGQWYVSKAFSPCATFCISLGGKAEYMIRASLWLSACVRLRLFSLVYDEWPLSCFSNENLLLGSSLFEQAFREHAICILLYWLTLILETFGSGASVRHFDKLALESSRLSPCQMASYLPLIYLTARGSVVMFSHISLDEGK